MPSKMVEVGRGKSDGIVCGGGYDGFVCILVFVPYYPIFPKREISLKKPNTPRLLSREIGIATGYISILLRGCALRSYEHNESIGRGDSKAKRDLASPRMYAG